MSSEDGELRVNLRCQKSFHKRQSLYPSTYLSIKETVLSIHHFPYTKPSPENIRIKDIVLDLQDSQSDRGDKEKRARNIKRQKRHVGSL